MKTFVSLLICFFIAPVAVAHADGGFLFGIAKGEPVVFPGYPSIIEYDGFASQIGRFERTEYLYLNPDNTFFGNMVWTDRRGNELYNDFSGTLTFNPDGTATATAIYEFTGGTGKFAGASGHAIAHVDTDFLTVDVVFFGYLDLD